MITLLPVLISGFSGGATRGLIGYLKHQYSYKNVGFDLKLFYRNDVFVWRSGCFSCYSDRSINDIL